MAGLARGSLGNERHQHKKAGGACRTKGERPFTPPPRPLHVPSAIFCLALARQKNAACHGQSKGLRSLGGWRWNCGPGPRPSPSPFLHSCCFSRSLTEPGSRHLSVVEAKNVVITRSVHHAWKLFPESVFPSLLPAPRRFCSCVLSSLKCKTNIKHTHL